MTSQSESLIVLKELFPDWTDDDLSLCLQESRGDLDLAIARISDGHATQFGEVKKKDKAPKRVEYGNGRGRGRGASTGAPRGRSEFRGRGRGRGASASTGGVPRNATETSSTWPTTTTTNTTGEALPEWASDDVTAPSTSNATTTTESKPEANDNNDTTSSAPKGEQLAAPLATSGNGDYTGAKPKSRIIDKNSKSSWASIAKPPAPVKAAPAVQTAALQTKLPETTAPQAKLDAPHAPLTEQNLEAATEDQVDLPQPPTATVASLAGEPATGPSSLAGGSVAASTGGPPGLKSGQQSSAARIGTPVGGRRLNQNEAVVMPGSEREPTSRLGVQFGSLGLGDDEVYNDKSETASNVPVQHKQADEVRHESYPPQSQRQDKLAESYGGYGGYGLSSVQQQQGGFGAQSHDQYSNFYGQEQPRASPFAGQSDYYQHQQQAHAHQISQQSYGGSQSAASQRTDTTSRPTEQSSRYGESSSSPMTSMGSQNPPAGTSPAPHHPGAPQQHSQYPMHPQYGAPNPYAYYGYGYGYPQQQQQHSAYAPMYGQQQRGGYGGQNQYQGAPVSHTPVGTSQDRFERSTAEYQRQQQQQQQMSQYSQGGFGNTDFLGSSRNAPPSNEAMDPFKGYNSQGSTGSRDDTKGAPTGFGGVQSTSSPFGGQQMQGAGHYGGGGPAGGQSAGQYGGNEQQGGQQQGGQQQGGQQGQYSQYGNYGRGGAHQQYAGGNGQWGQQGY